MLQHLQIRNFKGWKDTGEIRMAPITLFFGSNSSGKSSIGQFLMMLKQTVESQDRKAVFYPGGRNSAVQLGSFQEMVYQRNTKHEISFEYQWQLDEPLVVTDAISDQIYSGNRIYFDAYVAMENDSDGTLYVKYLEYYLLNEVNRINEPDSILNISMNKQSELGKKKNEYQVEADKYQLRRTIGRGWQPGAPVRFYGFPDEVVAYHQNAAFVQDLNLQHENLFKSIFYLGPLRTKTERLYSWAGISPESVGYTGEYTIASLIASEKREVSLGFKKRGKKFYEIMTARIHDKGQF